MRAIEIDGLFNTRATAGDEAWFVRSGSPDALTPEGEAALRALGVDLVLDLREGPEAGLRTHDLPIRSVPLYGAEPPVVGRIEDVYETLLRTRGHALAEAVAVLANAERGVLVHCTAGKDRTGLVVALAQLAAGAAPEAVVRDYSLSGESVRAVREAFAVMAADSSPEHLRDEIMRLHLDSPAEAMEHALDIIAELGGAAAYLRANGLSEQQLDALTRKAVASS